MALSLEIMTKDTVKTVVSFVSCVNILDIVYSHKWIWIHVEVHLSIYIFMCALIKSKQDYVSLYPLNIIFLFLVEEKSKFIFYFNFPLRGIVSGSIKQSLIATSQGLGKSQNVWKMITGLNMWNKCSKIESKGKHQGKDKEINDTEIIKIIHKTKHTHTHTHIHL